MCFFFFFWSQISFSGSPSFLSYKNVAVFQRNYVISVSPVSVNVFFNVERHVCANVRLGEGQWWAWLMMFDVLMRFWFRFVWLWDPYLTTWLISMVFIFPLFVLFFHSDEQSLRGCWAKRGHRCIDDVIDLPLQLSQLHYFQNHCCCYCYYCCWPSLRIVHHFPVMRKMLF